MSASGTRACQKELYAAAATYARCDLRAFGKLFAGSDTFERVGAKCRVTYAETWMKLQPGAACAGGRFVVGDGTVVDMLTGLEWEQKTSDGSVHDKDNVYTWSFATAAADGTAFTDFLAALNEPPCFAGQCDWRLPTRAELQTIVHGPCATPPCIDQDAFGPTGPDFQWSSTTNPTGIGFAWGVQFATGTTGAAPKTVGLRVRAVRGGY